VAVGDFNGDGKPDLVTANYWSGNVSVLLGNGDGSFQAHVDYGAGSGPSSVAVRDFNGDAKPDLAVANYGSNNVSVLLGNGDGTFQAHVDYDAGSSPESVAVGDFNGTAGPTWPWRTGEATTSVFS
jgi:6-phosphogluconolactonase (cycloisomerase 2 family)